MESWSVPRPGSTPRKWLWLSGSGEPPSGVCNFLCDIVQASYGEKISGELRLQDGIFGLPNLLLLVAW